MKIIFFGTPDFAVPSLNALIETGEDVISVITQPDRIKGRGHRISQPPVKEFAILRGIPVLQPSDIKSTDFCKTIKNSEADIVAVVAYGKIIPLSILKIPQFGCVNVHASLLPRYRGAAPIQWAIINGETKTGITTMLMDEGLDTGEILLREETEIKGDDNAMTLGQRLSEMGALLLIRTLKDIKENILKPIPQTGVPSYAPQLKKEDGRIKWILSAEQIFNLIRGVYPWPGAYCYLNSEKINIIRAKVINQKDKVKQGRIEKISDEGICVGTGNGILSILEVRPEGKKTMAASAFMHGRHLKAGISFDSL